MGILAIEELKEDAVGHDYVETPLGELFLVDTRYVPAIGYETMAFPAKKRKGGHIDVKWDEVYTSRYATRQAAQEGHARACSSMPWFGL